MSGTVVWSKSKDVHKEYRRFHRLFIKKMKITEEPTKKIRLKESLLKEIKRRKHGLGMSVEDFINHLMDVVYPGRLNG